MKEEEIKSKEEVAMETFNNFIANHKNVLVDFYNTGCGPCRQLSEILPIVKEMYGDELDIIKVNLMTSPIGNALAYLYGVRAVPTLMLFHEGKRTLHAIGARSINALVDWIKPIVGEPIKSIEDVRREIREGTNSEG